MTPKEILHEDGQPKVQFFELCMCLYHETMNNSPMSCLHCSGPEMRSAEGMTPEQVKKALELKKKYNQ